MSLAAANRRRTAATKNSSATGVATKLQLSIRKQQSLLEPPPPAPSIGGKFTAQQRSYLSRGLSVGRSIESIRQNLFAPLERHKLSGVGHLRRQQSLDCSQKFAARVVNSKSAAVAATTAVGLSGASVKDKRLGGWSSSTSSLLKSFDKESLLQPGERPQDKSRRSSIDGNAKADKNRINLNIVLSQTLRATNEREQEQELEPEQEQDHEPDSTHSDVEETSVSSPPPGQVKKVREETTDASSSPSSSSSSSLCVTAAVTVQRRAPLVRAMSAPVRGLDDHAKGVIAANKRQQKLRRRKIFTRNISCDKTSGGGGGGVGDTLTISDDSSPPPTSSVLPSSNGNKKILSRSRTVAVPDVITLVSLLSSEGSDSEREDNSTASTPSGQEKQHNHHHLAPSSALSPTRRAPLLRKTGKSVSFQDSYPPTFQLASKEYSHMIRRGSIAPLAARIRANRPPTAPPGGIFHDPMADQQQHTPTIIGGERKSTVTSQVSNEKENNAGNCNQRQRQNQDDRNLDDEQQQRQQQQQEEEEERQQQQHNYPLYVRSIKERECWKLHQKMSAKGVNVSYDTVLRGMLTPTEFRHFQKQRDHEQAKADEAAEAEAAAAAEALGVDKERKSTAIERLSESLLNGK